MKLNERARDFSAVVSQTQFTDGAGRDIGVEAGIAAILATLRELRHARRSLFLAGNGGSAAVASHAVTDFLNVAQLRASTLHDPSLLTCMANDYGYESAFARVLETLADAGDMLMVISSSGRSKNVCNAAMAMRNRGGIVVTLSAFDPTNALRALGDFNVWLDTHDYGFAEIGHQFVLHNLADRLRLELQQET